MEIEPTHLLGYAIVWTIFYFFLSHYIAELSRKRWTNWVQSEDSDEILMEALEVIVNEIEDRMHDKLEGATGASTIKALTKDNPMMGFVAEYLMKRSNLGGLVGSESQNTPPKQSTESSNLGLK